MKVLGWHVKFVRRNSARVVTLRNIYDDMKVWSRTFAVNVQSVSVQHMKWNYISRHTWTINDFAVVCATNISDINSLLKSTLRNVLISLDLVTFNLQVYAYVWNVLISWDLVTFNLQAYAYVWNVLISWDLVTFNLQAYAYVWNVLISLDLVTFNLQAYAYVWNVLISWDLVTLIYMFMHIFEMFWYRGI